MRKVIVYERAEDGGTATVTPALRARLVKTNEGIPVPLHVVDRIRDTKDPTMPWAETEDEYLNRIIKKDVPANAKNVRIVEVED
jgi:hypothetical protein